jgi:hypothetical protein
MVDKKKKEQLGRGHPNKVPKTATQDEEDEVPRREPKGGKAKKAESALEQLQLEDRTEIMLFAGVEERLWQEGETELGPHLLNAWEAAVRLVDGKGKAWAIMMAAALRLANARRAKLQGASGNQASRAASSADPGEFTQSGSILIPPAASGDGGVTRLVEEETSSSVVDRNETGRAVGEGRAGVQAVSQGIVG